MAYRKYIQTSLIDTLLLYTKLYSKPYSKEALIQGLPIADGEIVPNLFSADPSKSKGLFGRAASNAGLEAKITKIKLSEISNLTLPAILLLKTTEQNEVNGCILEQIDTVNDSAYVRFPESGNLVHKVDINDLDEEYFGTTIFLRKKFKIDSHKVKLLENKKHWFWGTVEVIKYIYKDVLLASFVINLFMIATPIFTMNVYDRVIPNSAFNTLWIFAIGVVIVYTVDIVLKFVRTYLLEVAGKKADIIMSSLIFEKALDLKLSDIPKPLGVFVNRLKEFEMIRNFMTSTTIALLIDIPFVFLFLVVIYYVAGGIVFVTILSSVILLGYTFSVKDKMLASVSETSEASSLKNGVLTEAIANLEIIKALNATNYFQYKLEDATGIIAEKSIKTKQLSAAIGNISAFIAQMNTVFIVIIGAYKIDAQELTLGAIIATVILSGKVLGPMGQVAGLISFYQHVQSAYNSIDEIMHMNSEHPEDKEFISRPVFMGEVEFKNVTFSYPQTSQKQLIDINLKIKPKEKVAILGKIGSGKSTIQKLILGFYDVEEGSVLLDGVDVRQIDPYEIRANVSYLPQETILFSGTARSNITLKNKNATDDEIIQATKVSCADEIISKHPLGFDLPIYEKGVNLSGGQAQSISLARTVLDNKPLFILDEPTKSFDSTTTNKVLKNLKEFLKDKTLILITHNPTDLVLVDRIILMDSGRIIMDGPKDEVISKLSRGK